ncbi:hypothetical protein BsWGS_18796 [Bradybaena similaris]
MRFHLKRSLQLISISACLCLCLNFFLYDKSTVLRDAVSLSQVGLLKSVPTYQQLIYPSEEYYADDRIVSQLNFVPESVKRQLREGGVKNKKIFVDSGLSGWGLEAGQKTFLEQKCKVPYCELTDDQNYVSTADVALFKGMSMEYSKKQPHQKWILFMLESPYHTAFSVGDLANWTATYRHDSTLMAPYEKFVPFNDSVIIKKQDRNYAEGKTKQVAWFVSNCMSTNNRLQYAKELAQYIQVDIYGGCGSLVCSRTDADKCYDLLNKDYKFYLSFENSNCRDYITEKFFINGLKHDVIPIVMGAAPEDYERAAPPHSYIHVDEFASPKELAEYLLKLDKDDSLYNEYFKWKGTGDIINTFFWCRVCALAHDEDRGQSWYQNMEAWWNGPDICIGEKTWRDVKRTKKLIADLPIVLPPNQ